MTDPPTPKRWHATLLQVERHVVPDNTPQDPTDDVQDSSPFEAVLTGLEHVTRKLVPVLFIATFLGAIASSILVWIWPADETGGMAAITQDLLSKTLTVVVVGLFSSALLNAFTPQLKNLFDAMAKLFHKCLATLKPENVLLIDVDVTFEIPLRIEMSWENPHPTLTWTASPAVALHGDPLSTGELNQLETQLSFESGSLEIAPRQVAIELSANPDNDQDLCLELRSVRNKTRLHIHLLPSDLLAPSRRGQPLPKIQRHGLNMDTQERQDFLQQLALAAQIGGIRFPDQLHQQVQNTLHREVKYE